MAEHGLVARYSNGTTTLPRERTNLIKCGLLPGIVYVLVYQGRERRHRHSELWHVSPVSEYCDIELCPLFQ